MIDMSKSKQILKLEPNRKLNFHGPFTSVVTSHLKLTNPSDSNVCFKIKTTAPLRYCVRPNGGVIKPNEAADISVMLQPFTYDPDEKNRHKFMVQSLIPSEKDDLRNLDILFKEAAVKNLMESKLKCVLLELPIDGGESLIDIGKAIESDSTPTNRHDETTMKTTTGGDAGGACAGCCGGFLSENRNKLHDHRVKQKLSWVQDKKLANDSMPTSTNLQNADGSSDIFSNVTGTGVLLFVFLTLLLVMLAFICAKLFLSPKTAPHECVIEFFGLCLVVKS